ncbi:hypothetical protein TNCV_1295461 [Trichonephila clavipes]|nr:hypothetical protein TNCV_1295461 [Trichonephila clavipes]
MEKEHLELLEMLQHPGYLSCPGKKFASFDMIVNNAPLKRYSWIICRRTSGKVTRTIPAHLAHMRTEPQQILRGVPLGLEPTTPVICLWPLAYHCSTMVVRIQISQ